EEDAWSSTLAALKTAPREKPPATIDGLCPLSTAPGPQVYEDYDCILNQTNIGANNNKFYIIQLLEHDGAYSVWSRWGRVGEVGQSKLMPSTSLETAKKDFEKKFREKTKNSWAARENFVAQPGKYTLIEVQPGAGQEVEVALRVSEWCGWGQGLQATGAALHLGQSHTGPGVPHLQQRHVPGCHADHEHRAASGWHPSPRGSPARGAGKCWQEAGLALVPPAWCPAAADTMSPLCACQVLADIEVAQSLQAQNVKEEEEEEEVAHPLDQDYALLCCQLSLLDPTSREYQLIQNYVMQTGCNLRILNIWQVARDGEDERFKAHDIVEHRRLLWHGTNVAVIAAILKSGLRIMPHSGGRVGKGIYFASENSKSACYGLVPSLPSSSHTAVGCTSEKVGVMFLTEVALGKPYRITRDDPTLCQPPAGYDSVLACGRTEPDPAQDAEVLLDGKKVLVCQGKPIPMPAYKDSSFSQSEYLVYQESQCRIRYLVQLHF
ncbi:Poly [ADP-ribose] polymerase 3, partial [Merops nubicus]